MVLFAEPLDIEPGNLAIASDELDLAQAPLLRAGRTGRRETSLSVIPPGEVRIAADRVTNSLVIQATPRQYRAIRQALEQLDVVPLQVLIEVTIAELTLRDQLRYGLPVVL